MAAPWARRPVPDTGARGCAGASACRFRARSVPGPEVQVKARADDAAEVRTAQGPFPPEEEPPEAYAR
eukprot:10350567-Alexandrium_andersonii.AAC.1